MESKEEKFELMAADQRAIALQSEQSVWLNVAKFEQCQRVATMLSRADFVPAAFRNNVGNCMIALDLADRMKAHPIMLMQTMYVVHGKPGFEGKFVSALINNSGRYDGKLKYEWKGEKGKATWGCRAWSILKDSEERVNGPWVDWEMVRAEGWDKKQGSKWLTMPEIMFMYRAASFFGKAHDSDLLMGMSTLEELEDIGSQDLVRGPGGVYTTGTEAKPAGLYDVTQKTPEQKPANNLGHELKGYHLPTPTTDEEIHGPNTPDSPADGNDLAGHGDAGAEGGQEQAKDLQKQRQDTGPIKESGLVRTGPENIGVIGDPTAFDTWFKMRAGTYTQGTGLKFHVEQHKDAFFQAWGAWDEETRETFKAKYERIVKEPVPWLAPSGEKKDAAPPMQKDRVVEEPDTEAIIADLQAWLEDRHPEIKQDDFSVWLHEFCKASGTPEVNIAIKLMGGPESSERLINSFNVWLSKKQPAQTTDADSLAMLRGKVINLMNAHETAFNDSVDFHRHNLTSTNPAEMTRVDCSLVIDGIEKILKFNADKEKF
jgi:hypothetical protein